MTAPSDAAMDEVSAIIQSFAAQMADQTKAFAMVVRFQVRAGSQAAVEHAFAQASRETANEEGVIVFHLNTEAQDPTRFVVYERRKSLSHLDAHLRTPYIRLLRDQLTALIVGEAEFQALAHLIHQGLFSRLASVA
ncbi:MAG: putative quinol monooxygenase [Roseiarcus sp.]|jgi:quinol monooxygenase YgiN